MTDGFTIGVKRTVKECVLFARSALLAFIFSSAIIPPQWLYAAPPSGNPRFHGQGSLQKPDTADDQSQMSMMIERQRRRDIIMGADPQRMKRDPYLLEGQRVEVETWRTLKANEGPRGNETLQAEEITTDSGQVIHIRYGVTIELFSFEDQNTGYTPPPSYSLESDIKTEFRGDGFAMVYARKTRTGKTIHKHFFEVPGVRSVTRSDLASNVIFRNGDVRNIVLAHHRLFDANQATGGLPLPLALVDAVDATELNPAPISEQAWLETYDWRRAKDYEWDASIPDFLRTNIRHGDDIFVERIEAGRTVVRRVVMLAAVMEALQGHHAHFEMRQDLLRNEEVFLKILSGIQSGMVTGQEHPDMLAAIAELDGARDWMANPTISMATRRSQKQWQKSPAELNPLESAMLSQLGKFTEHAHDFALQVNKRSTYPISKAPLEPGSKEALEQQALIEYANRADERKIARDALESTTAKKWAKLLENCTAPAFWLTAFAAANLWIYMLPNSPFFLQVKLFDLGNGIEGWTVSYWIKFWLVIGANYASFAWVLPLSFAMFSERILGRPTLHGWGVSFRQNIETGWEAFTTFGLNVASYMMISLRQRLANSFSWVGIKTPLQCLQVMQHGLGPGAVLKKKFKWVSDLGRKTVNAMRSTWGYEAIKDEKQNWRGARPEPTNPVAIVGDSDSLKIQARLLTLYCLFKVMGRAGLIQSGQSLDPALLKRQLGDDGFAIAESRYMVACSIIERRLEYIAGALEKPMSELFDILMREPEVASTLERPLAPLNASEQSILRGLGRESRFSRVWPRLAGNEYEFLRYHRAIASRDSTDVVADTFATDCGFNPGSMALAPGKDAYSSLLNKPNLIASDQGIAGVMGWRPWSDNYFVNDIGWIAMIPTDEKNYGDEHAVQIPFSMQNPQYSESTHNIAWVRVRAAKPATFFQTLRTWSTFINPAGADFWDGVERFGTRVSISQVQTWKPTFIVGVIGALIVFSREIPDTLKDQAPGMIAAGLFSLSAIKTFFQEASGFLAYRSAWSFNSVGVHRSKTEVREHASELSGISRDLASATVKAKGEGPSADLRPVEAQLHALQAYYQRHNSSLPQDLLAIPDVLERADEAILHAWLEPPTVTDRSEAAAKYSNIGVGVLTTIGQALVGALAWAKSESITWEMCGVILGLTYVWGRITLAAGSHMRARLSYGADLAALREALLAFRTSASEENRKRLFDTVTRCVITYRRYGELGTLKDLVLETMQREDDVSTFAENLYRRMMEKPPVDNSAARNAAARERGIGLCADSVVGAVKSLPN